MTYEQAIALIQQRYGTTSPYSVGVTNPELQTFLAANNVPSTIRTQIGYAYYTAQRTQTGIDSVLTSRGYLTPTTTTATPTATSSTTAGTISPLPTVTSPTTTTTTTSDVPVVSVPSIFTQPAPTQAPAPEPVTTIEVPTFTSPSLVNTQTTTSPAVTSTTIPTVYRTDREVIQDGKRYYVMSDGSLRLAADQTGITAPTTTTTTTADEQDRIRAMMGLPPLRVATGAIQVPTTSTAPSVPTVPVITVPNLPDVAAEVPIEVPVVTNPLPAPVTPTGPVPVIQVPAMPVTTTTPTAAQMGGSLEDQINYQSAIRRLTAQLGLSKESAKQQAGELRAQYEPQLRKAARDRYAAQVKALASLGARGISGAPGLSVAARRAGGAEADYRRLGLIGERDRQLSALNRTLTQQLADYEEELRRNQEQLTRATTLANQLTGANQ